MKKRDPMVSLIKDIQSLKIQGASSIIENSLPVLIAQIRKNKIKKKEELISLFSQIENIRITEPLVFNCFDYLLWQINKEKTMDLTKVALSAEILLDKLAMIKRQITDSGLLVIKNGFNIFTHCHSSSVEKILIEAKKSGLDFKVYLTETRPKFQGRITAEHLVGAGIKTTMIADSQSAYLISSKDNINIDMVLLGADAIFADGSCYNKIGSYGITLAAKNEKIPVYVAGTLLKFSRNENLPIEIRPGKEVWANKPEKLSILNSAFDQIPSSFINYYLTEFGLVKPIDIKKQVTRNYPWIINTNKNINKNHYSDKVELINDIKLSYLYLGEKINQENYLLATFKIQSKEDLEQAAIDLAAESSIGTWTAVSTQTRKIFNQLGAKVFDLDKSKNLIKVAYPLALFEPNNIPQLLSSIAGNIFGLKKISWLRLEDLDFPEAYVNSFPGPQIGADKIRDIVKVYTTPLIGCIIKPKMGLSAIEQADLAALIFQAGVNLVKDDENLTSQSFNPFEKRVALVMKKIKSTVSDWPTKIYAFNVSAETETMIQRSNFIKKQGGNCAMIDILTVGFSGLQSLRAQKLGLILHGHRAMHAALTKNRDNGISMLVIAKLARLAGIDQLHTGTIIGKMSGSESEVLASNQFLMSDWYGMKKTLPVASGGLHPALIPDLIKILGNDVIINFGGGIHGHPMGSKSGVIAVKQAVEAVKKGIKLDEYSKDHLELKTALDYWRK